MCKSETLICAYLCSFCFNIAWVDWDSGTHFVTKMNQFVWCETQADFVAALCEIFHRHCAQPKMDFSQSTGFFPTLPKWKPQKEEFQASGCGSMILKFQNANMLCMLCIWESSKTWEPWSLYSFLPSKIPPGRTRIFALMFWVFPPKCCCWKLMTCWCKTTRPYLCKRVLPKFLEFILNLVKLVIWQPWRNAEARSHVLVQGITFQICWNRSFPARPSKISKRGCSTRDAKNIRPDSIDHICWTHVFTCGWAVYGGLAQHFSPQSTVPMHWTSLLICCWMGGYMLGWPHEHCLRRLDIFYRQRPLMSHVPLNWCCVSRRFCCRRDPTIAGIQPSIALQAGWQPKLKQKVRWLGTSVWFCWDSRHNYNYIANIWIYTFCILKWMDLRHSLFVLDCQILSVWGPKTLPTQPTRLIREWNNFNMFRIARTLVVSVKFSSSLLDISSWR